MARQTHKQDIFTRFTSRVAITIGHAWVFVLALVVIFVWALSGPVSGFSDTWQLIINTSTTIITFLMVFIIQNTQNRDSMAINIKLDALMRKAKITDKDIVDAEDNSDKALQAQKNRMLKKAKRK